MSPIRFLRIREVELRTGLKKSAIYSRIKEGRFPKSIPLGDAPNSPAGWNEAEIADWQRQRIEVRDAALSTKVRA